MDPERTSVLVVDDEQVVRKSCERVLGADGQVVTCAVDGLDGLSKVRDGVYDVILVDLKMPALDGMALLKAIRSERPAVPVVIITGYPTVDTAVDAIKSGAFDYLLKPFTPQELSVAVRKALESKRSRVGPSGPDRCRVMSAAEFPRFVGRIMSDYPVWGPKARRGNYLFDRIGSPDEIALDYPSTILPPKKLFYPQRQVLLEYKMEKGIELEPPEIVSERRVLLGVHACDLHALRLLDQVMDGEYDDSTYRNRRRRTTVIGVDCEPSDTCFCASTGCNEPPLGTDLFVNQLGDRFLIEMGTPAGERILGEYGDTTDPSDADLERARLRRDRKRDRMKRSPVMRGLDQVIDRRFEDNIWDELGGKCLGCGSCSLVCPACYCFNVRDSVSLDLSRGRRERHWDSCLLEHFALVAGGHNFRNSRSARFRNRFYHKFKAMPEVFGMIGCVGCGRCLKACPAGIEIDRVISALRGGSDV